MFVNRSVRILSTEGRRDEQNLSVERAHIFIVIKSLIFVRNQSLR